MQGVNTVDFLFIIFKLMKNIKLLKTSVEKTNVLH
mgnify:CR=1 FL=1